MKTLGFRGRHLASLIFGESLTITLIGGLIGTLLIFPASEIFRHELGAYIPVFRVEDETFLLNLMATLLVALFSAIIPTSRAIQIRIADGLRRIG